MNRNFLAKNMIFLRKFKSLTQTEIEASKGIKRRNWSNWENEVAEPAIANLIDIANMFGVPIDWLLGVDLSENVHLMDNLPTQIEEIKCTSIGTSISTSNGVNEPPGPYNSEIKNSTDLLILQQLEVLTKEVQKIGENLIQK